jgi:hypothetical protein
MTKEKYRCGYLKHKYSYLKLVFDLLNVFFPPFPPPCSDNIVTCDGSGYRPSVYIYVYQLRYEPKINGSLGVYFDVHLNICTSLLLYARIQSVLLRILCGRNNSKLSSIGGGTRPVQALCLAMALGLCAPRAVRDRLKSTARSFYSILERINVFGVHLHHGRRVW